MFKYSRYVNRNSVIHALNPFLKLLITIFYIISVFLAKSLMSYLFLLTFLLIVLIFSFIPDIKYYKYIYDYKFLILFILLIDLIVNYSIKSLVLVLISTIFSILMLGAFTFTTKPRDLIISLEKLLYPLKLIGINTRKIAFNLVMFSIYKPMFKESKNSLKKELFNIDKELGFFDKIKIINKNVVKKTDKLNESMVVRNYFISKKEIYKIKINDYLFAVAELALFIAIIVRG